MRKSHASRILAAEFARPVAGPAFAPADWAEELRLSGRSGWQSNGGPHRGHPARSLPLSLEIPFPPGGGELTRIQLLGVFALFAGPMNEAPGTLGASVQITGEGGWEERHDLLNQRHYRDATDLAPAALQAGDGTSLETVGRATVAGLDVRVDLLTIDLQEPVMANKVVFRDLGSPASFVLFDAFFGVREASGCPFHSHGGGVTLGEIASIVRLGDRVRLMAALDQFTGSLQKAYDLDEARGQALTFLSMVTASTLEMDGQRSMHRVLLQAAREFDRIGSAREIGESSRRWVEKIAPGIFADSPAASSKLVDRALQFVDRNYARDLTDASVAAQLGLSTSHFRFLFKQATGQPFHKYLIALRLEKAKTMLVEQDVAVGDVAKSVGFAGLSHFSRAFAQRFHVSPTAIRKAG